MNPPFGGWLNHQREQTSVAGVIPDELRAVIELPGTRMGGAHVRGAGVWCYAGPQGGECSVSRLVGVTAATTGRRLRRCWKRRCRPSAWMSRLRRTGCVPSGPELGLAVREAHLRLRDRLGAVVLLYLSFDTFEPNTCHHQRKRTLTSDDAVGGDLARMPVVPGF